MWEVIVGNCGRVWCSDYGPHLGVSTSDKTTYRDSLNADEADVHRLAARRVYEEYVKLSKLGSGRAGGEAVVLVHDNEFEDEYWPPDGEPGEGDS